MYSRLGVLSWILLLACLSSVTRAQQAPAAGTPVPTLVNFNGALQQVNGKPVPGVVGITFSLYKDSQGGAPLWMETQNVQVDSSGHYSVLLGSTFSQGLPTELFANGEARWLGVRVQNEDEQPRVLLLSVPYALKAADAETLGGVPASQFLKTSSGATAGQGTNAASSPTPISNSNAAPTGSVTGTGTKGFLPIWTGATSQANSALFQSSAGNLGLATASPTQKFEVDFGNALVRGPTNFGGAGATAAIFIGDAQHPIEAIWNTGLSLGAFLVPQALFIQDRTGNVGIGTTSPSAGLNVVANSGLAGDFRSAKVGSTAVSVHGGPGSAKAIGGTGFRAVGGANASDGGTGGVGGSFVGGNATGINNIGQGGIGGQFAGGSGPQGFGFTGGIGLVSVGGKGSDVGVGGDGAHMAGGFGLGGGTGIVADGGGGDPSGCGGEFHGGPGVSQSGGFACVGGGNDDRVDVGADGIDAGSVASPLGNETYAGNFSGDLNVTGQIFAGSKDFRIDHPLDPANRYLSHASVESSEMKNIYDGTVTTDSQGDAIVDLPNWFEAVNGDFRYQLTVVGQFAQAIVSRKIANHQFSIKTDKPGVEVCWQVTGVRRDAFAKVHALVVEEMKPGNLRGFYIHPELYGQPAERQIEWARHPAMMHRFAETGVSGMHDRNTRANGGTGTAFRP